VCPSVDQSVGLSVGLSVGQSVYQSVGWSVSWSVGQCGGVLVGVSVGLSVGLLVSLSWLVELWAQVIFPPYFHRYCTPSTDRAALGYELTTSKLGSSMIWTLTLIVTLSSACVLHEGILRGVELGMLWGTLKSTFCLLDSDLVDILRKCEPKWNTPSSGCYEALPILACKTSESSQAIGILSSLGCLMSTLMQVNSLTAIWVPAGTKTPAPWDSYNRKITESTVDPNTTIPQTSPQWWSRLSLLRCGIYGSARSDAFGLFGRGWEERLGLVLYEMTK
jgi:hypothetical protein